MGQSWFKPAGNLVLALGTGFEFLKTFGNAVFDPLVVTHLKVQPGDLFIGAPVTPVERVVAAQAEGDGDELLTPVGQHQYNLFAHGAADFPEESEIKCGGAPLVLESAAIECVHVLPDVVVGGVAQKGSALDPGLRDAPAFPLHLLAFGVAETRQKIGEVAVAAIEPVVLHIHPWQESGSGQRLQIGCVRKEPVQ